MNWRLALLLLSPLGRAIIHVCWARKLLRSVIKSHLLTEPNLSSSPGPGPFRIISWQLAFEYTHIVLHGLLMTHALT